MAAAKSLVKTTEDRKRFKSVKKQCKEDALALAQIIYDIYKEELASAKMINGQNNAKQNPNN